MFPAPIKIKIGFKNTKRITVVIIEIIKVISIVCMDPLSALCLSSSPIYFDNAEEEPAAKPFPIPKRAVNMGIMNPTAAS